MEFYVKVIFWLILLSTLSKLFKVAGGDYPRTVSCNADIADSIFNAGIIVWGGIILWG